VSAMSRAFRRLIAFAACVYSNGTGNQGGTGYCAMCNGSGQA
jgi:hypothetical protein